MFRLILVVGSLCDDAIVVVENCQSLMEREGLSPKEAAFKCMRQITGAIIATTLVTVACYAPLAFYGCGKFSRAKSTLLLGNTNQI